jgi:pyruvate-formate lyase-activating enzyme
MHTKSTENSIRLGQWSRRLLGLCRRLWRLLRATEHLSWSTRQWKKDLNIWLQRSSPETYARLMEDNLLDRHLQRLLERAGRRYRELRQQGVSWRKARRLLELELAKEIGTVSLTTPTAPVTLPSVPSIPKDSAPWLEMLEQAVRLAAPEGYAEARRRGILQAHLENVLHWVDDQQRSWSDMERTNPDRRRALFEEARQRAVQIDWQTPPLRHDPTCWEQDLEQYLRWVSPERAAILESQGELSRRAQRIAGQLRQAWQSYAHAEMRLEDWQAFAQAAVLWAQHPWHDLATANHFRSLTVDIVGSCNARCPFCPRVAMPAERTKGFMEFDLFRRILERGRASGISTLYLYSTGEPTLHPRFDDFVALAKDLGYTVVCSTNGSMMHQRRRGLMLADVVQVSIEGWDRVSYERYRYPLRFDRVYGNVREYAACRPAGQRYVLNCLLTRKTDVEQYALLWGEFFDEIFFHPMYPTAGVLEGRHRAVPEPSLAEDYWWFEPAILPTCSDPFEKLTIAFDGKRVLCCQDFSASLELGHAEDDWRQLYVNPIVARVRRELLGQTFETCGGCGSLAELPAAVKAAFLAEIRRVWQNYTIRAVPRTFSLEVPVTDPKIVGWLRRFAATALSGLDANLQADRQPYSAVRASHGLTVPLSVVPAEPDVQETGEFFTPAGTVSGKVSESNGSKNGLAGTAPVGPIAVSSSSLHVQPEAGKRVLAIVGEVAEFTALAHLARRLMQQGEWQPVIYFTEPYPQLTKHVLRCRQWQLPVWAGPRVLEAYPQQFLFDNRSTGKIELPPLTPQQQELLDWCRSLNLPELDGHVRMLRREQAFFRRVLDQLQPAVLVLGQENVSKYTTIYSRTALEYRISTAIVPWCLASREEFEAAVSVIPLYDATTPSARRFCERFPQWRLSGTRELLRAPVFEAAALEILGCAPDNPWTFQSGFATALAVESPWMLRHYRSQGVPEHWLHLTGSWCDDALQDGLAYWHRKREQLCRELHLEPHRPLILAALPSNQLHNRRLVTDFSSFEEILIYWADTLAALTDCQTILVAHPSISPAKLRQLERSNVRYSDRPTYELMPLADALVACVSSVIRWALACGLPVVDYDLYRFGYYYFRGEPNVHTVETRRDFEHALANLARRLSPGQHVPPTGQRTSEWGWLDGQSTQRIASLLARLAKNSAVQAQAA